MKPIDIREFADPKMPNREKGKRLGALIDSHNRSRQIERTQKFNRDVKEISRYLASYNRRQPKSFHFGF